MTLFIICLSSDPKGIVALLYFLGYSMALCVSSLFPVAFIPKNDLIDCCDSACWVQWLVIEHSSMDGCAKSSYYWHNNDTNTKRFMKTPNIFRALVFPNILRALVFSNIFRALVFRKTETAAASILLSQNAPSQSQKTRSPSSTPKKLYSFSQPGPCGRSCRVYLSMWSLLWLSRWV